MNNKILGLENSKPPVARIHNLSSGFTLMASSIHFGHHNRSRHGGDEKKYWHHLEGLIKHTETLTAELRESGVSLNLVGVYIKTTGNWTKQSVCVVEFHFTVNYTTILLW